MVTARRHHSSIHIYSPQEKQYPASHLSLSSRKFLNPPQENSIIVRHNLNCRISAKYLIPRCHRNPSNWFQWMTLFNNALGLVTLWHHTPANRSNTITLINSLWISMATQFIVRGWRSQTSAHHNSQAWRELCLALSCRSGLSVIGDRLLNELHIRAHSTCRETTIAFFLERTISSAKNCNFVSQLNMVYVDTLTFRISALRSFLLLLERLFWKPQTSRDPIQAIKVINYFINSGWYRWMWWHSNENRSLNCFVFDLSSTSSTTRTVNFWVFLKRLTICRHSHYFHPFVVHCYLRRLLIPVSLVQHHLSPHLILIYWVCLWNWRIDGEN